MFLYCQIILYQKKYFFLTIPNILLIKTKLKVNIFEIQGRITRVY